MNQVVEISIGGITCQGCVKTLLSVFEKSAGIESVQIDQKTGQAVFHINSELVSTSSIETLILNAGFDIER